MIDLDIQAYFDSVGHSALRDVLDQRVRNGVIRRVLGKWLNAGVLDNGVMDYPEDGVLQGGCISPLLSKTSGAAATATFRWWNNGRC